MSSFNNDDDVRDLRERVERLEREFEQYKRQPTRPSHYFKWFITGFLIVTGAMILVGILQFLL
jgi:sugar-specific transcriptional regulator TrmB